jgi:FixJ family two-component response regulator
MEKRLRLTLADDNEQYLSLMGIVLSKAFPESSIASFDNTEDTLDHIVKVGTDLLITDHGTSGTGLVRKLRELCFTFPILMVSGSDEGEKEALAAGATEFLQKDMGVSQLLTEIKKHLKN